MNVLAQTRLQSIGGRRALAASLVGAAFTAVCAQIAIPLPGHPVPITMQVFAVVCCGMALGARWGAVAQLQYLAAGVLGAPVFAMGKAGPAALVGPTGGYLVGFVAGAFVIGRLLETASHRSFASSFAAGMAGVATVYVFGAAWLAVWSGPASASGWMAWVWGSAPYIGVDAVKVAVAARVLGGTGYLRVLRGESR